MKEQNLKLLINIERQKLREIQSNMDKLISSINKYNYYINEGNLIDILYLNQNIDDILNKIQTVEMNIISNNKDLNSKNKHKLNIYNKNNEIIQKYLPFMLLESMTT